MMTGTPGTNRFSLTTLSRKVMKARAIKATPKINSIPHSTVIVPNEKFTRSQNVTIRRNIHLQQRLIKGGIVAQLRKLFQNTVKVFTEEGFVLTQYTVCPRIEFTKGKKNYI
jgi:hypothetical protein